ncbi:MAG: hypothetical protein WCW93_00575 [Candidatus Paceibacterota bacterium]
MDTKNDIEEKSVDKEKEDENRTNNQNNTSASERKNPGTGNYEDDETS